MNKLMIEDALVEIGAGGGPVPSLVVSEVCLRQPDGRNCYVTLEEFDGHPTVLLTEQSILQSLLQADEDADEELMESLHDGKYIIADGEYEDIFAQPDRQWYQVCRYLIYLVRCEREEEQPFLDGTAGRPLDEIDIPISDVEADFMGIS